jgi:hypothetical protein
VKAARIAIQQSRRGGRPISRVWAKTTLHKNGFSGLFQAVTELGALKQAFPCK